MRLKELSVELRDRIVSRHRSGEGYQKMSAALTAPKNILKWKKFGTTKTLPRAGYFSVLGTWRLVRFEGKMNRAKYKEILDENLLQSAKDLRLDWKVHLPTGQ